MEAVREEKKVGVVPDQASAVTLHSWRMSGLALDAFLLPTEDARNGGDGFPIFPWSEKVRL